MPGIATGIGVLSASLGIQLGRLDQERIAPAEEYLFRGVMGILYEKFDNLSVPILAHGCYNAVLFITAF